MVKSILNSIVAVTFIFSTQAFAFITTISVEENGGNNTIIQSAADYKYEQLLGKGLTYAGNPVEAAELFSKISHEYAPGYTQVEYEVNEATGTVSIIVGIQGFAGFTYHYWIIKKAGN